MAQVEAVIASSATRMKTVQDQQAMEDGQCDLVAACLFVDGNCIKQLERIKSCLERGADINKGGMGGFAPLHLAARNGRKHFHKKGEPQFLDGYLDVARYLIDHGANVNGLTDGGKTPLHLAAMAGHRDMMNLLMENGADDSIVDEFGETPQQCFKELGGLLLRREDDTAPSRSAPPPAAESADADVTPEYHRANLLDALSAEEH